ncbi:MAG: hypothetical protein QXE01_04635 [Sulfolobales archaeon]
MVGGSKERYVLMWSLPRESIEELAENIGVDKGLAWRLTGGNPRALIDLKTHGINSWIEDKTSTTLYMIKRNTGVEKNPQTALPAVGRC